MGVSRFDSYDPGGSDLGASPWTVAGKMYDVFSCLCMSIYIYVLLRICAAQCKGMYLVAC